MHRQRTIVFAAAATLALDAAAQQSIHTTFTSEDMRDQRSFAVVEGSTVDAFGGFWNVNSPLVRYIRTHSEGRYVAFLEPDGTVHRFDDPARMNEVDRLYAPLKALTAKQEAYGKAMEPLNHQQALLAETQKPLADQQRALARQQRSASTPEDHGQIGQAQGILGQEQGDLGTTQGALGEQQGQLGAAMGALGRKQGEIARANYKRMSAMFDQCLKDGSCPQVGP